MPTSQHVGVYGVWRVEGSLVLVRKTRGPYTGLLDLPGGSPEPGETIAENLARELREETGVELVAHAEPWAFSFHVDQDSRGEPIDFQHRGWIAEVEVRGRLRLDIVDEDVAGATLLEAGTSAGVSPLVREALRLLPGEFRR